MKRPLSLINHKLGGGQEPSNKQRRAIIGGGLAALAASPLLVSPRRVMAQQMDTPSDPFILLLTGVYQPVPVGGGPNLGLSAVNLGDGSYSVTKIYPIFGIGNEGGQIDQDHAIGNFYVQFAGKFVCLPASRRRDCYALRQRTGGCASGFQRLRTFPGRRGGNLLSDIAGDRDL